MLFPDVALAMLINHTTQAYSTGAPAYITYRERTHVSASVGGYSKEIDRYVMVRNADNFAVMQDLPRGGENIGQAFPIIPYFDPLSNFGFAYFANLHKLDISITRGQPFLFPIPTDAGVDVVVPYDSYLAPRYAADSRPDALHLLIDPTSRLTDFPGCSSGCPYPAEIVEDPQTHLPSRIVERFTTGDTTITLDYAVIDGHWIVTHGTFGASQHALGISFRASADITFDQFAFPSTPPDPRLAGAPSPQPSTT
jgi:hypothetical protein